jgi:hypothetical protein
MECLGHIPKSTETIEKLVSIVILNYNGRKLGKILTKCLESVLATDYPNFEVLFVDNASEDSSVDFVMNAFGLNPKLTIIRNEQNLGYADGNNIGIRRAKGEYIVLLNNDTQVDPQWLSELV